MLRHSPSRNQRTKSVKVKYTLQIALLLAVCFWLIFQVKHSRDKKKEFDENNVRISITKPSVDVVLKLGRKDIRPQDEETIIKVEKHNEEEAEEEEEEKADGDDEIGDRDLENSDNDVDHQEDFVDDEKEREAGNEAESEKGQKEDENSLEDRNYDGGGVRNTHEAREEPYKADDASSAVTQATGENNIIEYDKKVNNFTVLNANALQVAENDTSNATTTKEKLLLEIVPSTSEAVSPLNSIITIEYKEAYDNVRVFKDENEDEVERDPIDSSDSFNQHPEEDKTAVSTEME